MTNYDIFTNEELLSPKPDGTWSESCTRYTVDSQHTFTVALDMVTAHRWIIGPLQVPRSETAMFVVVTLLRRR